ncbi:MAG TPA: hypothetical protein VHS09_10075 [Polyangiaceae bacterium]|nr:hypothetical protein [Polyangiaceae bacterium]
MSGQRSETTRRAGACALTILAVACSKSTAGEGFPDAAPADGSPGDAHGDAADAADGGADANADADASAGADAAELPECDHGKTCALPLTCDGTDLLCEPVCDAMNPCAPTAFCHLAVGAVSGNCIAPDYECLGDIAAPPPPTTTYFFVSDTFLDVSGGGGGVPAAGLTVKVCEKSDTLCATPDDSALTTASGTVSLTLPAGADGFDGYLDVTGPSGDGGTIVETLVFSSQPVVANGSGPTTNVGSAQALQQLVASLGTVDPTRALVEVVDQACRSTPAFGASLTVSSADGATRVGYLGAAGLVAGASSFPVSAEASAYVLDVPGTTTTLTTVYGGQTVNDLDVILRPGVLVVAYLTATPAPSP